MRRRSARAACRAGKDSALVAWYSSLYAPRTGGAYDRHHRTAGIAGGTRWRGDVVAARGAGAAGGISASFELPSEREVVTDRAMEAWYNSSIA